MDFTFALPLADLIAHLHNSLLIPYIIELVVSSASTPSSVGRDKLYQYYLMLLMYWRFLFAYACAPFASRAGAMLRKGYLPTSDSLRRSSAPDVLLASSCFLARTRSKIARLQVELASLPVYQSEHQSTSESCSFPLVCCRKSTVSH